jgi:hypothetical protein
MVGTIAMPPALACQFTWGEVVAVLRIIGDEVKRHGSCSLYIDAIAAMAGMHRTTVQNALRQARRLSLITVEERRPPGRRKSLTNIVRVVSEEWLTWLRRGPRAATPAARVLSFLFEPLPNTVAQAEGRRLAKLVGRPLARFSCRGHRTAPGWQSVTSRRL